VSSQGYATQVSAIMASNPCPSPRGGTVPPAAQPVLDQLATYGTGDQVSAAGTDHESRILAAA